MSYSLSITTFLNSLTTVDDIDTILCQDDNVQDTINGPIDEENYLISAVKIVKNNFYFAVS